MRGDLLQTLREGYYNAHDMFASSKILKISPIAAPIPDECIFSLMNGSRSLKAESTRNYTSQSGE